MVATIQAPRRVVNPFAASFLMPYRQSLASLMTWGDCQHNTRLVRDSRMRYSRKAQNRIDKFLKSGVAWLPFCQSVLRLSTTCAKKVFRFCFYMCARIILFSFFFVKPIAWCGIVATLSHHPPARYHFFTTLSRQHCDTRRTPRHREIYRKKRLFHVKQNSPS